MNQDKNEMYNYLTSFMDEEVGPLNFFKGFNYRYNFFRFYDIIKKLEEESGVDFSIVTSFEYNSEDEETATFKKLNIAPCHKKLLKVLKPLEKEGLVSLNTGNGLIEIILCNLNDNEEKE